MDEVSIRKLRETVASGHTPVDEVPQTLGVLSYDRHKEEVNV